MAAGTTTTSYLDETPRAPARRGTLGEVLALTAPFALSSGVGAVKLFCDRMMLAWHSDLSMAAALSAGMLAYFIASPFMGMVGYASAFVSQYDGAGRRREIGICVWHSLYLAVAAGLAIALVGAAGAKLFMWAGHEQRLAAEETVYFRLLTGGSALTLAAMALSCFWIGRGKTWTVLAVNIAGLAAAAALNKLLIFGAGGVIPAMGIAGAGLATVGADALRVGVLLRLFLGRDNRDKYDTLPRNRLDRDLARRFVRFGFGNGVHLMFSIGIMALFHIVVGRHAADAGGTELVAASGIAFSVNSLAFIPVLGLGTAVSVLVARGIGSGNHGYVRRVVRNGRLLTMAYAVAVFAALALFPSGIAAPFARSGGQGEETAKQTAGVLLLAAAFFAADAMGILYAGALRGAGDTGFSAKIRIATGGLAFALPCLVATRLNAGLDTLWHCVILYAACTAAAYGLRFRKGGWKHSILIGGDEKAGEHDPVPVSA